MLLDGLAARYKVLENEGRQFTSLQIPGDFFDLHLDKNRTLLILDDPFLRSYNSQRHRPELWRAGA
jgi:hypothetical protein